MKQDWTMYIWKLDRRTKRGERLFYSMDRARCRGHGARSQRTDDVGSVPSEPVPVRVRSCDEDCKELDDRQRDTDSA